MRAIRAILWILGSFLASKIVGNFVFEVLNEPGAGVNLVTAFIPAVFSAVIFSFGIYKAFFEKKKTAEPVEKTSEVKVKADDLVKIHSSKIPSMEDAYQTVIDSVKTNFSIVKNSPITENNDDSLWERALVEFDEGTHKKGLWAKCFSQANGDENIAKANYLKMRVIELKSELDDKSIKSKDFNVSQAVQNNPNEQVPKTISCPACHTTNLRSKEKCVSCQYDLSELTKKFGD